MGSPIWPAPRNPMMSVMVVFIPSRHGLHIATRVDPQLRAGDEARCVAGEEQNCLGDVRRLDVRHAHRLHGRKCQLGLFPRRMLEIGSEHPVHPLVVEHVGVHVRRVHSVDADVLLRQLHCEIVDVARHHLLREAVRRAPGPWLVALPS